MALIPSVRSDLDHAVLSRWAGQVRLLVSKGAKLTTETYDLAIRTQQTAIVAGLVRSAVVPTVENLELAVKGKNSIVRILIEAGAKPRKETYDGAINRPNRFENAIIINHLGKSNVRPTTENLNLAVKKKDYLIVRAVVGAGGEPTEYTYDIAIQNKDYQSICNLNFSKIPPTISNLDHAVDGGDFQVIYSIAQAGVKPNSEILEKSKGKPFMAFDVFEEERYACPSRNERLLPAPSYKAALKGGGPRIFCEALMESGAMPTQEELELAVQKRECIDVLIAAGAKPTEKMYNQVIENGDAVSVRLLAESGVPPTTENLNLAVNKGDVCLVEAVVEAGAIPTDDTYAKAKQNETLVDKLRKSGVLPTIENLR